MNNPRNSSNENPLSARTKVLHALKQLPPEECALMAQCLSGAFDRTVLACALQTTAASLEGKLQAASNNLRGQMGMEPRDDCFPAGPDEVRLVEHYKAGAALVRQATTQPSEPRDRLAVSRMLYWAAAGTAALVIVAAPLAVTVMPIFYFRCSMLL